MPLLVKRRSVLDFNKQPEHGLSPQATSKSTAASLLPAALPRPVSEHGPPHSHSRLSHELSPDDIPDSTTSHDVRGRKTNRFSLMRFRNVSESALSTRMKMDQQRLADDDDLPPVPAVTAEGVLPKIVKTAPTNDILSSEAEEVETLPAEEERKVRSSLFKRASSRGRVSPMKEPRSSMDGRRPEKKASLRWNRRGKTSGLEDLHRLSTMAIQNNSSHHSAPPSYSEAPSSALALPLSQAPDPRFSESSRSDGSSGDGHIYGSTTTTTHTVSTHTTFFRLPRRNKNRNSLFPLPLKIPSPDEAQQDDHQGPPTPRASSLRSSTPEVQGTPGTPGTPQQTEAGLQRRDTQTSSPTKRRPHSQSAPNALLAKTSLSFAEPGMNLFREGSHRSQNSRTSSPLQPPMRLGLRGRSSTNSSFARTSQDVDTPPPLSASGRNSSSTTGRSSLGGFLSLSRFRQSSEPHSPGQGSPGDSFAMSREALVIPEREEGDTPGKYLERLESAVSRSVIAGILSKSSDPFAAAVLRSYTRRFPFFGEPIDMSLRKFLLEAELPKETQQVDRVIQAFADRYHECNPGIFVNSDQAYVIAFSIMMLHTDAFNKNNKRKMQKQDYIKNTSGQGLSDEILACFYDNICYTPFVHYEEDVDINGERVLPFNPKQKKPHGKLKSAIPGSDAVRKPAGPVDPYNLLVEQQLDTLRPAIKDSIMMDDPYDYRCHQGDLDVTYLQRAFTHTGILQIISARSRPAAYESQVTNASPTPIETQQGIVDLKITKVGTLWRKSSRKKKTRSPWQEWGAILTGSQLYLFKNSHWAKGLMHQFQHHQRSGHPRTPVVFKPPLHDFKPDALIKTDNAVALVDSTYNRHKNAFIFVRPGGQEEVLLADNEAELTDWLGLINYAAAFRAAGVRIRGMLGGAEEDLRNRDVRRLDSTNSVRSVQTPMGEIKLQNRGLSPQLQRQVMAARRQIMVQKIAELEQEITDANKQLENMLRNGRHVLVLAPIAPRTREDVIHAAAQADAMIKWLRRDVWRLKCHRDIIAMDVRLDGLSAGDLEKIAHEQSLVQQSELESGRKDKPKMLARLSSSKPSAAKSPPQSPSMGHGIARPSTTGSVETPVSPDVFRTPPESATALKEEGWRIPPLELKSNGEEAQEHRPSVSSSLLSPSSPRHGSLTHSSSASSILQTARTHSSAASEGTMARAKITPTSSIHERELQLMARSTMGPAQLESAARALKEAPPAGTSPESSKHKGVRRSLHKTLRDAGTHHHSTHKHRRNKESDSTVRSAGVDDRDNEEATPGLQRDKPRFILHGKQASVVQFGGDWEKMKIRREQYESQHAASPAQTQREAAYTEYARRQSEQHELLRAGMVSPAVHEFNHSESIEEDEDDPEDMLSVRSFREDAEAAAAYSSSAGPIAAGHGSMPLRSSEDDGASDSDFFDSSSWDPSDDRRQTVIGPSTSSQQSPASIQTQKHRRFSSLEKDENGNVSIIETTESSDEDEEQQQEPSSVSRTSRRSKRVTVLGPSISSTREAAFGKGKEKQILSSEESVEAPAPGQAQASSGSGSLAVASQNANRNSAYSEESIDGEHGFVQPISDEELLRMSSGLGR